MSGASEWSVGCGWDACNCSPELRKRAAVREFPAGFSVGFGDRDGHVSMFLTRHQLADLAAFLTSAVTP